MITTNASFDTYHALDYIIPIYLIHFDGETTDYCNFSPVSPDNTIKEYLLNISGLDQRKTPQEGRSSIGGIQFEILDVDDEITALLATDTAAYFQARKVTIKAGYLGMTEANMLTIGTNLKVNSLKLSGDGTAYLFEAADPMKAFQKYIFRGADDSNVVLQGNCINVLLSILTSSGTPGTNGAYDSLAAVNGLNLDSTEVDITGIEAIRDNYYPGNSHWMHITITDKEQAMSFLQREFFKPFNLTPAVTSAGLFTVKPFKPPLAATTEVQTFDEDVIVALPKLDFNLAELVNEVDFKYDHDGSDFTTVDYHQDSTSLTNRLRGIKPISIESKGIHSTVSGVSLNMFAGVISNQRGLSIFNRYATPPVKISFNTLFYQWLSEFGDVVPFTHSKLPDIVAGTKGLSADRMEVIQRGVDWKRGEVKFEILNTGFARGTYQQISPTMTIVSGTDSTHFEVSSADGAKFANLTAPVVSIYDSRMRIQVSNKAISSVSGTTVTIASMGLTPTAGWIVTFADYDNCTAEQKLFGFIADSSDNLGAANDDAHLMVP